MIYNFDLIPDRRNTNCLKWETYAPEVIPMWVADMDFPSPQPVIDALSERVAHGVFGYPTEVDGKPNESSRLCEVFLEYLARQYGWTVQPEALVFLPGVVTAFNLASLAFAGSEGAVLVQTPVYPPMLSAAQTTGAIFQEMELMRVEDGSYQVDWDDFQGALTKQTRLFILCNPHNPVGRMFRRDELEMMAEICLRNKVIICSDEIHCDLTYPGSRHIPIASLAPEIAAQTITLMAPSKTYNLAGLQCSIAIIPDPALRKLFLSARKGVVPWVNFMGLLAARVAYEQGGEWLDQLLVYLHGNRDFLCEYIRREFPGISMGVPQATYLAWLDCRKLELTGGPYQYFLEKARVAFNDGEKFGRGGEGFVRLNFGCSRKLLFEALERVRLALE
jgi:cysteine-S-conjugate beta-lyase